MASKFSGIYVGLVVDNNDPKKLGRLKISIPSVYGNIKNEDLPWAEPCFPYGHTDKGIFFIPEKNSLISVMFINGSPYKPIWLGAIFRENENVVPSEAKDIYPQRKIIKTNTGYLMFDDDAQYIELKHRNGSTITLSDDGDIIIHAANDVVILSDRYIKMNPSGKESVIPLKYIKTQAELDLMSPEEVNEYKKEIEEYNIKVNTNCGNQSDPIYQRSSTSGPSLGNECKSQAASPMRQWGATQRNASSAMKNYYKQNMRTLSKHRKGNIDYRFNAEFASRIEAALDYMQQNEPDLYEKFMFTDGFREGNKYGASDSMHKYGAAFDFNYSSYDCNEREKVYYIFAKFGIACPLNTWNGQDEGMHMEPALTFYSGEYVAIYKEEETDTEKEV